MRGCPETKGLSIRFVQAGQLHLQLYHSHDEATFLVHERWLSRDTAMEVQFHDANRCGHLRTGLLIARDGMIPSFLILLSDANTTHLARSTLKDCEAVFRHRSSLETSVDGETTSPLCCKSHKVSYTSGEYKQGGLNFNEEYFFALVMPQDPESVVAVSHTQLTSDRPDLETGSPGPVSFDQNDGIDQDDGVDQDYSVDQSSSELGTDFPSSPDSDVMIIDDTPSTAEASSNSPPKAVATESEATLGQPPPPHPHMFIY